MIEAVDSMDSKLKEIAYKLRKIRELKGLSRETFCEPLNENSEYWGLIERGEQAISLVKLLQACEYYDIPIESVVQLNYQVQDTSPLKEEIVKLLDDCTAKQLEVVRKFMTEILFTFDK